MSMDARAKIEEMLRRKREGTNNTSSSQNTASPNVPVNVSVSVPTPIVKATEEKPSEKLNEKSNASTLSQINEMLRQKQVGNSQASQISQTSQPQNKAINNTNVQAIELLLTQPINEVTPSAVAKARYGLCPSCLADLELVAGLYACKSCSQHFVRRGIQGDLINCSELPYGYCRCCEIRFPLVKSQASEGLNCSVSREAYLLSAKGYLRASELPFGLCSCCQVPNPLIARPDRTICCINSNEEYIKNIDGTVVPKPAEVNLQTNQDIEGALNQGMAAFYYGGFIGGQEPEPPPVKIPKRQRRRWFS